MGEGAPKGPPTQDQQGQRGECTGSGKWGMDMRRRTLWWQAAVWWKLKKAQVCSVVMAAAAEDEAGMVDGGMRAGVAGMVHLDLGREKRHQGSVQVARLGHV